MEPKTSDTVIRLTDVSFVRDRKEILHDINFTVDRNDFVAISGPNGGGKSTLLRLILRLLKPTSGKVQHLDGGKEGANLKFGYLPQKNVIDSGFPISVREVIASGLIGKKDMSSKEMVQRTEEMLQLVGMENFASQSIGRLSGGQLQRTLLARALVLNPDILVLDEPLSYIDKRFEYRIYEIISSLVSNRTILLVSHEMSTIGKMATRHVTVNGTLRECDSPDCICHSR